MRAIRIKDSNFISDKHVKIIPPKSELLSHLKDRFTLFLFSHLTLRSLNVVHKIRDLSIVIGA
jgi:hypothetical protein